LYSPFQKESELYIQETTMAVKRGYNDCISTIKPVRDFLDVMSGKWKFPILVSIGVGNDRFVDIQESIPGITPKVLAKELKDLEQHELIKRNVIGDYPVKITYTHEPYAATLTPIIYAMKDWGINHRKKIFGDAANDDPNTK
jgi:DNA-binding HxlR family transcriptional regulator